MSRFRLCALLTLAFLTPPLAGCGGGKPEETVRWRIAVIPKGTTHEFWQSIHAGALAAAKERGGVRILWEGPAKEDQRQEQQQIVERFVGEQAAAIILAPCDRTTLVGPVENALARNIPVVIIDSGLQMTDDLKRNASYLGYIATDNHEGGVQAARRMVELLKDKPKPKVLMLPYQAGSESTEQRERGFAKGIRDLPGVDFHVAADEAGATADSAQKVAERLLSDDRYRDIDGFFAPNESSTLGVLQALRGLKRTGQIALVGFDASEILVNALRTGELHGLVMQDPFDMGYQSVMRAVDHLEGKTLPKDPDARTRHTNLKVATRDNLSDPAIRNLYARDLRPFLGQ